MWEKANKMSAQGKKQSLSMHGQTLFVSGFTGDKLFLIDIHCK